MSEVQNLLRSAVAELKKQYYSLAGSSSKEKFHLVTESDIWIEKFLIQELQNKYPGYGIYSEEAGSVEGDSPHRWIIDPIDGTADFVFGVPYFAISICLETEGEIQEGYVYSPMTDELYHCIKAEGKSYLNGRVIQSSMVETLEDSLVAFGFSANCRNMERYCREWHYVMENCRKGMPLITPALTICNVARGRTEAFIDFGCSMEGQAAAALILINAGGKVFNYDFSEWSHREKGIIATNGKLELQSFRNR